VIDIQVIKGYSYPGFLS